MKTGLFMFAVGALGIIADRFGVTGYIFQGIFLLGCLVCAGAAFEGSAISHAFVRHSSDHPRSCGGSKKN